MGGERCLLVSVLSYPRWSFGLVDARGFELYPFACELPGVRTLRTDTRLVFTSENASMSALQFNWKYQSGLRNSNETTDQNLNTNGGFKLNWTFRNTNKKSQNKDMDNENVKNGNIWTKKNRTKSTERNWNLWSLVNLAGESKTKKVLESVVWEVLLKHRWDKETVKHSKCLDESQIAKVIFNVIQELGLEYTSNTWLPQEDLSLGTEFYSALYYCPDHLLEAARLSVFFESLISSHSLRTVVAATMHNIQPRAADRIRDFTAINNWYRYLDGKFNVSLGPAILNLFTSEELAKLAALDSPFIDDKENHCIGKSKFRQI